MYKNTCGIHCINLNINWHHSTWHHFMRKTVGKIFKQMFLSKIWICIGFVFSSCIDFYKHRLIEFRLHVTIFDEIRVFLVLNKLKNCNWGVRRALANEWVAESQQMTQAFSHSWPLFNYLGNLSSKWLNRGDTALFGDTHEGFLIAHSPSSSGSSRS